MNKIYRSYYLCNEDPPHCKWHWLVYQNTRHHLNVIYPSIWCTWPWSPLIMQVNNLLVLLLTNNTWVKVAKFVTNLHLEVQSARNQRGGLLSEYTREYSTNGVKPSIGNKTLKLTIKKSLFDYFYFQTKLCPFWWPKFCYWRVKTFKQLELHVPGRKKHQWQCH